MSMLGINVTYMMKPGARDAFLSELAALHIRQAVLAEAGCLQYDYFRSVQEEDSLLLVEKWTDAQAQKTHLSQPHMAQVAALKAKYVSDTRLELYQLE